jgi:NodT family efflux transporter outer membrane factor (OMF) lipoprotein
MTRHLPVPALLLATLTTLVGCTVGPDYRPPVVETGDGWTEPAAAPETEPAETPSAEEPADLGHWWRSFGEPELDRLVERALEQNLDVRQAAARVAEARALLDAAAGGRLPSAGASANVTQQRLSKEGLLPVDQIPGFDADLTIYDVGFDAAWELDLFGRTRRAVEAAGAQLGEATELRRGAQMTVAAEVARVFLDLRGTQRRLAALRDSVMAARRVSELVKLQVDAGEVAAARLAQVETDRTALEARLPALEGEIRAAALSLGVLTGGLPESELDLAETDLSAAEIEALPDPVPLAPLPVGERADLLRRRPDVRAAERRLATATARIGLAIAELFPRLTISAAGGFQAMDPAGLGSSGSETFSIVPFLSWRIFEGGRIHAEIRATEARTAAAALAYEKTVKEALTDAERALTRYRHGLEALERQTRAVDAARRNRHYARLRYEAGEVSLFELLDAERSLARARETEAETHTAVATGLVALFKALGGGWEGAEEAAPRIAPGTAVGTAAEVSD